MTVDRLPDWETRFAAYLESAAEEVRAGRSNYCAMFAAGSAAAITGEDPRKAFRGRYAHVRDNLEATIDELYPPRLPAFARRGDLAWHAGSVGVVVGSEALFVGEAADLVRVPRSGWEKAWSVGNG